MTSAGPVGSLVNDVTGVIDGNGGEAVNIASGGITTFRNEGTGKPTWPFDEPQFVILNLAIGGTWGGAKGIDDSLFPHRLLVDYVRVYREK